MTIYLPGYQIFNRLYESSKSLVYRAVREEDKRSVILKVLKPEYSSRTEFARYKQEYEIVRSLKLEGVISAYSLEKYENTQAIAFEDFGGQSLKILMAERNLTLSEFLAIALNLTETLGQIHAANIIHKDINPSNIVFNPETGQVKLIDFGIATVLSRENPTIKNPHILEGTLPYMSPEQTGRMNRSLDYRSDFYSLGVTFYEMLVGTLPFAATDAMELIHNHIAVEPLPPCKIKPEIPKAVSDIVMKLLAKTAENRYQSAWGIEADLAICQMQLDANGEIEDVTIGENDVSDKFQIPQKLYGREREIETLLAAFERVSNGPTEMMLVSGCSGIGKSALVQELYKPVTKQRGYFISGKFEQLQRNIPYSAVIKAFQELIGQLLTESEDKLNQWREKLTAAFGANGQPIADVIPEVELIVGKQPAVAPLQRSESQNRFKLVFQNFIRVFSQLHHPFVIFLDDLQWADSASLELIESLLCDPDTHSLFLIGAYRQSSVGAEEGASPAFHPLIVKLGELRESGAIVNEICLSPLELSAISELISDTLKCDREKAKLLAELVLAKTQGNPFFVNEFLHALYAERLLYFDWPSLNWHWSIEQIKAQRMTDNVAELMTSQLQKLKEKTRKVLQVAAAIGNQFEIETLAIAIDKSALETAGDLWEAVAEGLVVPLGDAGQSEYKFAHDRIQQAAYSLLPDAQKQAIHRKVGQVLLQNAPPDEREVKIFEIVNHLNLGREAIASQQERCQLAELNLIAGRQAKAAAARSPAIGYLTIGAALLENEGWQTQYELALALHVEACEAASAIGDYQQVEALAAVVLQQAKTLLDKVKVCELKIQAQTVQNNSLAAVNTALEILTNLGLSFPQEPTSADIQIGLEETVSLLAGRNPIELPEMNDPIALAAVQILSRVSSAAWRAVPNLFPLLVFKQVALSVEYGNAAVSALAYVLYGAIVGAFLEDIDSGYQFGQLAVSLLDRFSIKEVKVRTIVLVHQMLEPWKKHVRDTLKPLRELSRDALEIGDLEYAAKAALSHSYHSFFLGTELEGLEREFAANCTLMRQLNQETAVNHNAIYYQAVLNLRGRSGEVHDDCAGLPLHGSANDREALFYGYLCQIFLCYLFEDFPQAVENSEKAEEYLDSATSILCVPVFYFYDSLARLAVYSAVEQPEQKQILAKVAANQRKMKKWAETAPMNFLHKFYLVAAERQRAIGHERLAIELYDRAISTAKENEYLSEQALSAELAARFYLTKGKEATTARRTALLTASIYLQEARDAYLRWGAVAKVSDLEARYPQLLQRKFEGVVAGANPPKASIMSTSRAIGRSLDITTVMKASQAIASEIVLDKLLETLMKILIQNAGAQKGFLILLRDDKLLISAEASVEREAVAVQQSTPVEECADLPLSAIEYVKRSRSDVVLSDAAREGPFTADPYIAQRPVKSLLCTAIVNQRKLIGILYLENNLIAGAFTPQRLEVLRLLSSQAAISLENALLYAQLEEKVAERTQELNEKNARLERTLDELRRTQAQLIHTEKMSSLGQLVAGIAHEINNPVSFIYGNVEYAINYFKDLLTLIRVYQEEYPDPSPRVKQASEKMEFDFLTEDLKKLLNSMKAGAERIRNIVGGLRNFSRLDEALMKPVNIHDGIESTLMLLQPRLREENGRAEIEVIREYSQLPKVTCYASQLNQVFVNILNNAIDALRMEPGASGAGKAEKRQCPAIRIRTEMTNSDFVTVKISDNGPGMTADVQKRIFDPFFTTKPVGSGTGLGLSISYSIVVERHGGKLSCISGPGEGAEFAIEIPTRPNNQSR